MYIFFVCLSNRKHEERQMEESLDMNIKIMDYLNSYMFYLEENPNFDASDAK
jgi:hypothetical protein